MPEPNNMLGSRYLTEEELQRSGPTIHLPCARCDAGMKNASARHASSLARSSSTGLMPLTSGCAHWRPLRPNQRAASAA
jgi:hypothetical protein